MQKIRDLRKQNVFEKSYLEATCTQFEIHSSSREKKGNFSFRRTQYSIQ